MQEKYRFTYAEKPTESLIYLHPEQIRVANRAKKEGQGRNAIIRLSESIKRYGILQPLSVRLIGDMAGFPAYELVSGERRLRAARLLGLEKIPCTVLANDDRSCAIAAILADLNAKRLNIFEQASAFRLLAEEYGLTQEEIARKVGISQSAIANKLRLLRFSREEAAEILRAGLSERHARALLRLASPQKRAPALDQIIKRKYNVAATEALVEAILAAEKAPQGAGEAIVSHETFSFLPEKSPLSPEIGERLPEKPVVSMIITPEMPPQGVLPRKFAMQDLRPLYNSIERTLSIFRKTGQAVECRREESDEGVKIIIHIPRRA